MQLNQATSLGTTAPLRTSKVLPTICQCPATPTARRAKGPAGSKASRSPQLGCAPPTTRLLPQFCGEEGVQRTRTASPTENDNRGFIHLLREATSRGQKKKKGASSSVSILPSGTAQSHRARTSLISLPWRSGPEASASPWTRGAEKRRGQRDRSGKARSPSKEGSAEMRGNALGESPQPPNAPQGTWARGADTCMTTTRSAPSLAWGGWLPP